MIKFEISNVLKIDGPEKYLSEIKTLLTISNPKYVENAKMGRYNGSTNPYLCCFDVKGGFLSAPRGFVTDAIKLANAMGLPYTIDDNRNKRPLVDFNFIGKLHDYQDKAITSMSLNPFGVLEAPTGTGKTTMALYMVALRQQPTLIIVHNKELLNQWVERIETFLGIPKKKIGIIGDGKYSIGYKITVGIVNSVYKNASEISKRIGFLIIDETHRIPGRVFSDAVSKFSSAYMLGLSATPYRRDGLTKLIHWYIGPKRYTMDRPAGSPKVEVIIRNTEFDTDLDPVNEYSKVLMELTLNRGRNRKIVNDVMTESQRLQGVCLVLSDRKKHVYELAEMLRERNFSVGVLTADENKDSRDNTVKRLNANKYSVLVATGQLIGEGFDSEVFSSIFLTTPIKFSGRLTQYLGRILRTAPGKTAVRVYDYVDVNVDVLRASARSRQKVYKQ